MFEVLFAPQSFIFGVALCLMFLLFILEMTSLIFGGVNDWIDGLLPDSLVETAHTEIGIDSHDAGVFIHFLSWLYVGRVPVLMILVIFLTVFGLTGFGVQIISHTLLSFYLNMYVATLIAWLISLPIIRLCAKGLYKILPKDETSAISDKSLVGLIGEIVLGEADHKKSAQAKVKDIYGQNHYVMVYADDGNILKQGDKILLVSKDGMYFRAILNSNAVMVD